MNSASWLLWPIAQLFILLVWLRGQLYRRGFLKAYSFEVPVISVGNLTVGGTGKTPLCDFLLKRIIELGKYPALVSRGYGAQTKFVRRVDVSGDTAKMAKDFGDEPSLLALRNLHVPVWVGANRLLACQEALAAGAEVLLLDDAFQNFRIQRDLNILIIDASEPTWHYRPLPVGRSRELWPAITRADLIVLSKVNLVSQRELEVIQVLLSEKLDTYQANVPVVQAEYSIKNIRSMEGHRSENLSSLAGQEIILLSGIGRPKAFEEGMAQIPDLTIKEHIVFPDHHSYSKGDIAKILAVKQRYGVARIVTTGKDGVKLTGVRELADSIWIADLTVSICKGEEELDEALSRALEI